METGILVVSIETTCWEEGTKPPDEESDIIEIGACLLDTRTGARSDKRTFKVHPTRSTISLYCILKTGSTSWEMKRAISFADVCSILEEEYSSKSRTWASFGRHTQLMFEQQCADMGISYPFATDYIDVERLFGQRYRVEHTNRAEARQHSGLPIEHYYRSSGNAAWEIAGILYKMLTASDGV
jgi:inhibitor of KinA sporulation pathway (predicted exonuclease)